MELISVLALAVFVGAYALIALEHNLGLNKSGVALMAGAILWVLAASKEGSHVTEGIAHAGNEVFSIVIFLLAAMSLVEILVHYNFFDVIRGRLYALHLKEKHQFLAVTLLAFFLSGIIDNLTATIIMIQISRQFFRGENLLKAVVGIIIAANAGGAFSPVGDVTTIMLWFAEKFSAIEIITRGFLPSLALYAVSIGFMYRTIDKETADTTNDLRTELSRSEKLIITSVFASFGLPVLMSLAGLPPYMGLLFGLGVVWVMIDGLKRVSKRKSHLNASLEQMIQKTDIASLKFFVGILLAVAALHELGVLESIAEIIYGEHPSEMQLITGNIGLGLLSSILDNVPLTAIAIQIVHTTNTSIWVLLAITAGTGGSLLVIGSAAGVVAMGMVKELTFGKYIKLGFVPALLGFATAVSVWALQYWLLGAA